MPITKPFTLNHANSERQIIKLLKLPKWSRCYPNLLAYRLYTLYKEKEVQWRRRIGYTEMQWSPNSLGIQFKSSWPSTVQSLYTSSTWKARHRNHRDNFYCLWIMFSIVMLYICSVLCHLNCDAMATAVITHPLTNQRKTLNIYPNSLRRLSHIRRSCIMHGISGQAASLSPWIPKTSLSFYLLQPTTEHVSWRFDIIVCPRFNIKILSEIFPDFAGVNKQFKIRRFIWKRYESNGNNSKHFFFYYFGNPRTQLYGFVPLW